MAKLLWSSGGSTSFSTPGNWTNLATGLAYGSAIASSDEFYFRKGYADSISPISDLNNAALTGVKLFIEKGWPGNIGADGNPLIISAAHVVHEGNGTVYFQDGNGSTNDFEICQNSLSGTAAKLYGGTFDRVHCSRGSLILAATAVVATLEVGYKANPTDDATVSNLVGAQISGEIIQVGGKITLDAIEIVDWVMGGGTAYYSDSTYSAGLSLNDLFMTGGYFYYNRVDTGSSDGLARAFIHGGTVDLTATAEPKEVTYAAEYGTGRLIYRQGIDTVTTLRFFGSKGKS